MQYERFEQLPVWQSSIDLAVQVYAMTAKPAFRRHRSLCDQIERAAVSVSNNVAERFERAHRPGAADPLVYCSRLGWRSALDALSPRADSCL